MTRMKRAMISMLTSAVCHAHASVCVGMFGLARTHAHAKNTAWAWHTKRVLLITMLVGSLALAGDKKLIEFGWDEPDTAFMRAHVREMEKSPFDGCVFHIMYAKPD